VDTSALDWAYTLRSELLAEIGQIESGKRKVFRTLNSRQTDVSKKSLAVLRDRLAQVGRLIEAHENAPAREPASTGPGRDGLDRDGPVGASPTRTKTPPQSR